MSVIEDDNARDCKQGEHAEEFNQDFQELEVSLDTKTVLQVW
eukprot:CAMPEP_0176371662 /NCGR_PEP_ID=MMETSP0126-20121128/24857_1 /TAXON_ID=141414 ORGANISM="Strombidinopsis acuminatum, Strain SPMC142" /NCGR_SAMPLE_ID=MMETSP0126 /ASSEMBLY_ACC=CAM_ASM_000229 /LENGTH=41 /DNA_ID= /DNA_START= /DNA_END= /DNA_ORIENTATION=